MNFAEKASQILKENYWWINLIEESGGTMNKTFIQALFLMSPEEKIIE